MTTQTGTIACDLTKIPPEIRERLEADLRAVFTEVQEVRSLADGYALRLAAPEKPGLLSRLGQIVDYDRLCCPFIGHAIIDEPCGGPIWLHFTGTAEVRAFIAAELATILPTEIATRAGLRV